MSDEKQYGAFAADVKALARLRCNEVSYVPGVFEVQKVIVLSKADFEKLAEDISPEYPFIKDNRQLMSATPGGMFRCLLVRAEGESENMLVAQGKNSLYLGYGKDYRKINLKGVPVEHIPLEEPRAYQEMAVFFHKPRHVDDLAPADRPRSIPERQTGFRVEKVVVLADAEYRDFKENGLTEDQIFLFDNSDRMWFDPGDLCWHCLLIKGETSRDGILVEAEGYSHARYAAFAPDCDRLRLQDVPVHYEYPAKPSKTTSVSCENRRTRDDMER